MKKIIFILTVILLSQLNSYAQKFELGKVTIDELSEKVCPTDTTAPAAILFKKGKSYFEYVQNSYFILVTEVEVKVKIYKKEGLNWADKEVSFYVGGDENEELTFSKATTYNLLNGKVQKTKLGNQGEFKENINKYWTTKKITFPNVQVGSIIEYKYTIKTPYFTNLQDWDFQEVVPVNHSEYTTVIPEYYSYNFLYRGNLKLSMDREVKNRSINFYDPELAKRSQNISSQNTSSRIFLNENVTKTSLDNIPAFIEEPFSNNRKNYISGIQYELSSIQYPNQNIKIFSESWDDVAKSIYNDKNFGKELEKFNYFLNDIKPLVENSKTNQEKTVKIFEFVKHRMTWNGEYGYLIQKGIESAYSERIGNVAEINLMLVAMLKMAGIEANPVLISTRENGIVLIPNRSRLNYVIASAIVDGKQLLLDATNKKTVPNVLPIRDLNWKGRLIQRGGKSSEVDLIPKMVSENYINLMVKISDKGEVDGKIKEQHSDYSAFSFRDKYADLTKESYLEILEKTHNNIEVSEYDIANKMDLDKPVIETYSFKNNSSVDVIGDKMYFSPLLFFTQTENPFKQEKRDYPVDFTYPTQDKFSISITIPDGFNIESIPAPVTLLFGDNLASFKYNISNTDKQIQVSVVFDINTSIVSSEYYNDLKTFFAQMIEKETEKVVLKKI